MKNIKNFKTTFFTTLIVVIVFPLVLSAMLALITSSLPLAAQAQKYDSLDFTPQTPISGTAVDKSSIKVGSYDEGSGIMTSDLLAKYIQAFYNYGLAAAGILAAIVLMAGGLLWLTSGGNDTKIGQAKELITGSIAGTLILFSSWIILNTINPDLLKLKVITMQIVQTKLLSPNQLSSYLLNDVTTENPEVCCIQYDSNNNVLFCGEASVNRCKATPMAEDVKKIATSSQACVTIPDCVKNALTVSCVDYTKPAGQQNFPDGSPCKSPNDGYCFDGLCLLGDGAQNTPCSYLGSTCVPSGTCGKGYSGMTLTTGRDCGEDLDCCVKDGEVGDLCGTGDHYCVGTSYWTANICPNLDSPAILGRSCNSPATCCPIE